MSREESDRRTKPKLIPGTERILPFLLNNFNCLHISPTLTTQFMHLFVPIRLVTYSRRCRGQRNGEWTNKDYKMRFCGNNREKKHHRFIAATVICHILLALMIESFDWIEQINYLAFLRQPMLSLIDRVLWPSKRERESAFIVISIYTSTQPCVP